MSTSRTGQGGKRSQNERDEYAQVFLYRVPKANHAAFADAEGKLAIIFRRCGILRSDFYVVRDARIFRGFQDVRTVLSASSDEEVWVEVDTYRDAQDSVQVIARIGQDPAAGPLFAKVLQLAVPGALCIQGNADRVHP